ncbi:hypothetical protein GUITHDRAFT_104954 [Guillardia theta CCMP2712]|uniref:Centrosomal protein of 162 kDa n=1 Tax=Guillardia theta (strain CCMP2712) TaxID=905079 RepID=L1JMJ8_GUITC|nr:hypothetical protein GUITHDRAFT_104954 [Guillardia theta CCMP2712]EKX49425.1 hypothetical protein GUITHDRAFT_104954 [Guillardia theta CCMP2712]|eukprot:XP_005836405.1 hypothetical protein GUITHDRAFT_104954 [Guillardia theta CCMP2712]
MRKEEDEQALQRSWDVVAGSVAYVEDIMQQVEMSLLRMQKMHEEELNALLNRFEGKIASLEDVADTRLVVEVEAELRREREMHRKELEQVYLEVSNLKEERSRLLRRIEGMESEKLRSELGHGRSQDSLSSASRFHTSSSHLPPGREPSERIQTLEKSISEMMRSLEEKDQEIRLLSRGDSHERQRAKMSEVKELRGKGKRAGEEEKILLDFEQMKKSNADLNMLVQGYKEKVKKMEKMLEDERSKSQVDSSSNFGLRSVLELEVENTALKQLLRENEEHRSKGDEEEVKKLREANLSLQETLANLQEEFMSLRTQHDALLAAPVGSASAQGQARPQDLIGIARWSSGGAEERLKDVRESDKLPRSPAIGGALSSSSSTITSSKRNLVGLIV